MKKNLSLYLQAGFYVFAGFNHFFDPDFYYPLIPEYFGSLVLINIAAGVVEIVLGLGLLFPSMRKLAAFGIIAMLVAFIPSHDYFNQIGSCIEDGLCVPQWVGWLRLVVIHPLLIIWAWSVRKG